MRDIDIAGMVVDQEGKPVGDVKLLVNVAGGGGGHRYESLLARPDGTFSLRYEDTIHCYGHFSKEGYYTDEIRFHPNLPVTGLSEDGDALMGQKDLRVVLEEVGPATELTERRARCEFRADGEWVVMPLVAEGDDGTTVLAERDAETRVDMAGKNVRDLPPDCLYQRADLIAGTIAHATETVLKVDSGGSSTMLAEQTPARVYLGISGPGNGLVLFEPGEELRGDATGRMALRAMKEAPEDGYRQELLLDQAKHRTAFFYMKVGDWYGKGRIPLNMRVREPRELSGAPIRLWIQPDGSRNVRSLDWSLR